MKHVKLFENWMEDEDNDQTSYVDAPVAHADMQVGDEEMAPEDEDSFNADSEAAAAEETYADGIGYDDSEVEEEEEAENEEE